MDNRIVQYKMILQTRKPQCKIHLSNE
uniref:Uncharacterized protein n=1 Tax=Nelumbo nucifera TaxID=4432 RepID=A0A822Z783_NELNU|nr:TPA_asm: hypothetical protein HUJ06_015040 [Nelumbo nucifera]